MLGNNPSSPVNGASALPNIARLLPVVIMAVLEPRSLAQTTFTDLGVLPGQQYSNANAVSNDGSAVVGNSGSHAFRWTMATGMQDLGAFGPSSVSADGSVVAGTRGSSPT